MNQTAPTLPLADIQVTGASRADLADLLGLIQGLAQYLGKPPNADLTTERLAEWLFGNPPAFHALIARQDGAAVGYLIFYPAFSLFKVSAVLLVENLYVSEAARGSGAGAALMCEAAREARRRGFDRLELNVSESDKEALAFYRKLKLRRAGETVMRIEDAELISLAGG